MVARIIYDIGANDGADTGFYLAKGFKVIAVEADPALCDKIGKQYQRNLNDGRLKVVNIGVSDKHDTLTFFQNEFSEWSSFQVKSKATTQLSHNQIAVPTAPLREIIENFGTPYYVKIDIEGFELKAISSLSDKSPLPVYLSFEVNHDWVQILDFLELLGFDGFQIVRQGKGFLSDPPNPPREGDLWPKPFTNNQSGCFGLELSDAWLDRASIDAAVVREAAEAGVRLSRGALRGWHDIHARRGGATWSLPPEQ